VRVRVRGARVRVRREGGRGGVGRRRRGVLF